MKWRIVEDDRKGGTPLPGRAGELAVVFMEDRITVLFNSSESSSMGFVDSVSMTLHPKRITVSSGGSSTVYAPASETKRKRLPVPEFEMTLFSSAAYKTPRVIHHVRTIDKPPDPNREWNTEDALVTAVCGYSGWVQPKFMHAVEALPICPGCC